MFVILRSCGFKWKKELALEKVKGSSLDLLANFLFPIFSVFQQHCGSAF